MKKLLLLGTSLASVEIVQTAKKMGCYTIVTDNLPPDYSEAKKEADEYWMISTDNLDMLEQKCKENNVNAIFAGVSEFNLDRVKVLTERLGLPCYIEDVAWKYARDKSAFKQKCREIGIPIVEEYSISDPPAVRELRDIEYPVVVKPIDGTGNKGLSICYNAEELIAGCEKARENSDSKNILVERYIQGDESWHYYYLAEDVIRHVYSGRVYRQPGYPTYLYSFGTSVVQDSKAFRDQVDDKCIAFLRNIGCKRGIAWFQFIKDEKGKFYALEMAQRMSADSSGKFINKVVGVNVIEWLLDIAFGEKHTADMIPASYEPPYRAAVCVYYHFADRAGTISSMQGYRELDSEKYQVSLIVNEGDYVEKYRNMVRIVFSAQNSEEMCNNLREINDKTRIFNEKNENMCIQFTDYDQLIGSNRGLFLSEYSK